MPGVRPQRGIALNPSFRPWRDPGRLNPDSWWDPESGRELLDREVPFLHGLKADLLRVEFPWWAIENEKKGQFDWSRTDLIVNRADEAGLELVAVLVFTPAWATPGCGNPQVGCRSRRRMSTCPARPPGANDFGDFVFALASRYRGRVRFWELWNEPDLPNYFAGPAVTYAQQVLAPGYAAVKAADSDAQVIFGGPSVANTGWVSEVLSSSAGYPFDILAFHDYGGVRTALDGAAALAALAPGKPIWLGEFGSERTARQETLIEGIFGAESALDAAIWYELRDDEIFSRETRCGTEKFGLLDRHYVPKRSFRVFRDFG